MNNFTILEQSMNFVLEIEWASLLYLAAYILQFRLWGTGIRGLMRGMATPPR